MRYRSSGSRNRRKKPAEDFERTLSEVDDLASCSGGAFKKSIVFPGRSLAVRSWWSRTRVNYHDLVAPLIAPDKRAFRTSSIVFRFPGAMPPHSNRVAAGVQ